MQPLFFKISLKECKEKATFDRLMSSLRHMYKGNLEYVYALGLKERKKVTHQMCEFLLISQLDIAGVSINLNFRAKC